MIRFRHSCIPLLFVAGLWLSGCATPSLDRGFVIRTDLRTTDCLGEAAEGDINVQTDSPYDFLTRKTPGENREVDDCIRGTKVLRAAGLALRPGDVLFLATGPVSPRFAGNNKPAEVMFPTAVAAPVGLALRKVHPVNGRLYQEEDVFLAGAFAMAGRKKDQVIVQREPLAHALDRHQLVLWNTLIDSLRLWRPLDKDENKSGRPGLVLLIDYAKWCGDLRARIRGANDDVRALTVYFSGTEGECPGDDDETERRKLTREYSLVTNPARSALHAIASEPRAAGNFPSANTEVALHTNLTVQVKGARIGATETYNGNTHWTLADWESAGICVDEAGAPIAIQALQMRDGRWVYLKTDEGPVPTMAVQLVFTQSLQIRRFVAIGPWYKRWQRVLARGDLDKLYASDIRAVTWTAPPADSAMCVL